MIPSAEGAVAFWGVYSPMFPLSSPLSLSGAALGLESVLTNSSKLGSELEASAAIAMLSSLRSRASLRARFIAAARSSTVSSSHAFAAVAGSTPLYSTPRMPGA